MKENSLFRYIGNHIGVDLINTQLMSNGALVDLLVDSESLRLWAAGKGIQLDKQLNESEVAEVGALRTAVKALCNAEPTSQAIRLLNQYMSSYSRSMHLSLIGERYTLVERDDSVSIQGLLGMIAFEVGTLLASEQVKHVKHCEHEKCVLMFLDISKNKKRRWCSMEACGNRAKASAHYRKKIEH